MQKKSIQCTPTVKDEYAQCTVVKKQHKFVQCDTRTVRHYGVQKDIDKMDVGLQASIEDTSATQEQPAASASMLASESHDFNGNLSRSMFNLHLFGSLHY